MSHNPHDPDHRDECPHCDDLYNDLCNDRDQGAFED